ncbi:MAG: MGMT family protein [Opitutaceae bacterium]|nr:MGMT family protein [Opitutaceae bacterium]
MAAKQAKSWREKLARGNGLPKVVKIPPAGRARWGGATLAIPAPRDIDALMRTVPKGRVTTINELRAAVARKHKAAAGCPITTGIFSCIAARAAEEAFLAGEREITPYWRTLKKGGELNPKFPGGVPALEKKLAAEGHAFVRKGARVLVANLEQVLYSPAAR